jgi:predicted DNA-binding protein (UPF0251 family)
MPFKKHPIGALIVADPDEARSRLVSAFRAAKANQAAAARELGVAQNTFIRWIVALRLRKVFDAIVREAEIEGWAYKTLGRPRGKSKKTRARSAA